MLIKRANSCLTLSVFLIDWYVTIDLCFPSRMTREFFEEYFMRYMISHFQRKIHMASRKSNITNFTHVIDQFVR